MYVLVVNGAIKSYGSASQMMARANLIRRNSTGDRLKWQIHYFKTGLTEKDKNE